MAFLLACGGINTEKDTLEYHQTEKIETEEKDVDMMQKHTGVLNVVQGTGGQPPLLYSVLYGIICKRRCILPRNFSLEKNQIRCIESWH